MNFLKNIVRFIYYTLQTYFLVLGIFVFISFLYPLINTKAPVAKEFYNLTDSALRTNCKNLLISFLALSVGIAAVRIVFYLTRCMSATNKEIENIENTQVEKTVKHGDTVNSTWVLKSTKDVEKVKDTETKEADDKKTTRARNTKKGKEIEK